MKSYIYYLGIDIGNTHTVIGLFDRNGLIRSWRISTRKDTTKDELASTVNFFLKFHGIDFTDIKKAIISSVVPPCFDNWSLFIRNYLDVKPINAHNIALKLIKISYPRPHEIGTDRLINSLAAYKKYNTSCIIIDFGTATTFDCVSENGEYLGGAIAPGVLMSITALSTGTSKLPLIKFNFENVSPIGKSTEEAIKSGIFYGFLGLTDNIIKNLMKEFKQKPKIIATGGFSPLIFKKSKYIDTLEPDLTLEGLFMCLTSSE